MKFYYQLSHSILLLLCMKSSFAFTLAEVWQATLAHSSEYQAAIHNRDAELEREQQSKAAFFPQISAQASYQRQPPSISSSKITHGWNVQLNQSIFDATRMAQYRQSQVNSQLAHSRLAQHHEDLLLKVSQVYFDLLLVRERILAVKAEKDAYQQQVKKAQEAFRNGTGTILDVHEAQAGYDGAVAKEVNETASEEDIITLANIQVPEDAIFEYKTSDKLDDLKGIWIIAKRKNGEQLNFTTLSGLFNLRIKIQELIPNTKETDILFKPVIRSSNSVYYPNILSSIFIPANDELNEYSINLIREEHEDGSNAQTISKNLKRYKNIEIDSTIIQKLINNNFSERELEIAKTENQYRFDEYKFITEKDSERVEDKLIFNKIDNSLFQND